MTQQDGQLVLADEIEATHIGCEYGEYDHAESYQCGRKGDSEVNGEV